MPVGYKKMIIFASNHIFHAVSFQGDSRDVKVPVKLYNKRLSSSGVTSVFVEPQNDHCRVKRRVKEKGLSQGFETHFKKPRFLVFLKKPKNLKSQVLGFLGFLIFKSEFLFVHCKFL